LEKLNIEEKGFGLKLTAPRDSTGHCDRAIALSICLPAAANAAVSHVEPGPDPLLGCNNLLDYMDKVEQMEGRYRTR
jgi:hypothetical protein